MNKKEAIQAMLDGKCVKFGSIIYKFEYDSLFWWDSDDWKGWRISIATVHDLTTPAEIVENPQLAMAIKNVEAAYDAQTLQEQRETNLLVFDILTQLAIAMAEIWPGTKERDKALISLNKLKDKVK